MTEPKQTATDTSSQAASEGHKYVISEEVIHRFVGNLKLKEVQGVAGRLALMSEICRGLLARELERDYIYVLRGVAERLSGEEVTQLSEAILTAIDEGDHLLTRLLETINRARQMIGRYAEAVSAEAELGAIARLRVSVPELKRKSRSKTRKGTRRSGKGAAPRLAVRYSLMRLPLLVGVGRFIKSDEQMCRFIAPRWRARSTLDGQPASATRLTPRLACPGDCHWACWQLRGVRPRVQVQAGPDTNCLPSSSGTRGLFGFTPRGAARRNNAGCLTASRGVMLRSGFARSSWRIRGMGATQAGSGRCSAIVIA